MKYFILTLILFNLFQASSQEIQEMNQSNVANKFDILIKNSNNYQDYKVVKKSWLKLLKKQVTDSISDSKSKIEFLNSEISKHLTSVNNLSDRQLVLENEIKRLNTEKESFDFLGSNINKGSFKTLFWVVSGGLTVLLLFFIIKYQSSNRITKETKSKLDDLEHEFEEHRRIALEREQKVMRKLQDEINKHKTQY